MIKNPKGGNVTGYDEVKLRLGGILVSGAFAPTLMKLALNRNNSETLSSCGGHGATRPTKTGNQNLRNLEPET